MSNFSQPTISSITLDDVLTDTITLTSSSYDTITLSDPISLSSTYTITGAVGSGGVYNYPSFTVGGAASIGTISSIDTSQFTISLPEEWVNCFPDFDRIEKMCEQYPGLKIAYEKFVTTYNIVKDDYDHPKDKK
jgi:hypothetical protein